MGKNVAVIGMGRVGLPFALVLANKGFNVTGVDVDKNRLEKIQNKEMPFMEEGAAAILDKSYGKNFIAVHETELIQVVEKSQILILTLGTPIDENYNPNFSQITDFFKRITPFIGRGTLIILRSTISPGVTSSIRKNIEAHSKFKVGRDIFLAYGPERIAEGKSLEETGTIPQILGCFEEESLKRAKTFFKSFSKLILPTDPLSAELAKLYCNIYRYIDFAIGNEFMMIAENQGANMYEILKLVNFGYKRSGLKSPGLTAGPCLVKDSFFLLDRSPYLELMIAAWRINENTPGFLLQKIKDFDIDLTDKKVAVLGLSFKKNVDDIRYSLAPKIINHLLSEGAIVKTHDPYIPSDSLKDALDGAEVVVIAINHDKFEKITPSFLAGLVSKSCIVSDIWNMLGTGRITFHLQDIR